MAARSPSYLSACLCRRVKLQLSGEPFHFSVCHCENCKKWSGSAFSSNTAFKSEYVNIIEGKDDLTGFKDSNTTSGHAITRFFCSNCGSSLFIKPTNESVTVMSMGCIEGSENWVPKKEGYKAQRLNWVKDLLFRAKGDPKL